MFDIGWPEMAVVAVIALVVVGPKDLPRILRSVGRWAGKARRMAREFQRNFDDMVSESELGEVKKSIKRAEGFNPVKDVGNFVDPTGAIKKDIESLVKDAGAAVSDSPDSDSPDSDSPDSDSPDSDSPDSDSPDSDSAESGKP